MEILHNQIGDFANSGMRPRGAQALTLEGLVRYQMNREQERLYHTNAEDTDTVPCLTFSHLFVTLEPKVGHYDRWLKEEANELAEAINVAAPYPTLIALAPDNGERFLYDYYLEQVIPPHMRTLTLIL